MHTNIAKQQKRAKQNINLITLGCSKNLVDSERLLSQLHGNGLEATHEDYSQDSGIVVINTCGFIDHAKEESVNTILQYAERKSQGLVDQVIVTGCLSQRYKDDLKAEIPEVDAWFGTQDLPDLVNHLGAKYKQELIGERQTTTDSHYAYLKIAEGCNRPCSFCAIPLMRGKHNSRSIEMLVDEAKFLVSKGVKELMLIAQDLTYYGLDLYGKRRLNDLLKALSDVEGLEWIRLHYAYPSGFPVEILPTIRERSNICNYLDMPLQHISDNVLKHMRRGINQKRTEDLVKRIREEVPGLTLRTTMLVGHPGETDADHHQLLRFLEEAKFDRLGVFTYSHEENTHAGDKMEDLIDPEVKEQRKEEVMELQQDISFELNRAKVGQTLRTLIDREEDGYFVGRTEGDSPEVDNEVIIRTDTDLAVGEFYPIQITDAMEYDLMGQPVA
ncbi:MAG: 30S ribosomal protein S12 methylthiotransferase RimO [Bacteroidota bacterium]